MRYTNISINNNKLSCETKYPSCVSNSGGNCDGCRIKGLVNLGGDEKPQVCLVGNHWVYRNILLIYLHTQLLILQLVLFEINL